MSFRPQLHLFLVILLTLGLASVSLAAGYPGPNEIAQAFDKLSKDNSSLATLEILAESPGGRQIKLLKLSTNAANPAIFVMANMEGNAPVSSAAAIRLAELLVSDWKEQLSAQTWYILPLGNPDGFQRFFDSPLTESFVNDRITNADQDDATDEDPADDLNGDGLITIMRQAHPEGEWIELGSNPLLMKKANQAKGEQGLYRIFDEGLDNDGDGEINEDGLGGTNPGRNFPHRFKHFTTTDGSWAASEEETRGILTFFYDHPEIAMTITFGRSNTLTEPPPADRRGESGGGPYKLPKWWSRQIGVDENKKFPIGKIVEMAKDFFGDSDIDEDRVLRFLDGGAAVNPHKSDMPYLEEISEQFKEFLKEIELEDKRLKSASLSPGCFEEFAYYQFGGPSFSYDFWSLPEPEKKKDESDSSLTADQVGEMSTEDFLALGEEKIAKFLTDNKAPEQFSAERLMKGFESGRMDTKQLAKMIEKYAKSDDDDEGDKTEKALYAFDNNSFVTWTPYDHPTLGKVEIGGAKPWATLAPPYETAVELIDKQLPFIKTLSDKLAKLEIGDVKITKMAASVFKLEVWVVNEGFLPYPMAHGKRTNRPGPAILSLEGKAEFLENRARQTLPPIGGLSAEKTTWLIKVSEGKKLTLKLSTPSAGSETREIVVKGEQS